MITLIDAPISDRTHELVLGNVRLLQRAFQTFTPRFEMRLWDGSVHPLGEGGGACSFTLVCHNPHTFSQMVLSHDRLCLAEAYFKGDLDVEGDFFAALRLKDQLYAIRPTLLERLGAVVNALRIDVSAKRDARHSHSVTYHSPAENKAAIGFHYDVSNAFYALWLDPKMVYSCAYYENQYDSLATAQTAKLDHICRKLRLNLGERLLDIGSGWGALILHAAKQYGVFAHGITLSEQQFLWTKARIEQEGLQDLVSVELLDYRDLKAEPRYDKVASIGMFEHVGLNNLPLYFQAVSRVLKPDGVFLNHGITHETEGWKKTLSTEFINRYIFPDGQLDTVSNIQRAMEQNSFVIEDVESLRQHYALTLRAWVDQLERHHQRALGHVDESTYRIWRLYMAACALEFESGDIGVYQILATRRGQTSMTPLAPRSVMPCAVMPLTRRYMYPRKILSVPVNTSKEPLQPPVRPEPAKMQFR
jgi:cyclopropane-fatty-acyl-phospholipid synthase